MQRELYRIPRAVGGCPRKGKLRGGPTPQRWGSDLIRERMVATTRMQGILLGCLSQSWSVVTRQQETTLQGTDKPRLVAGATESRESRCYCWHEAGNTCQCPCLKSHGEVVNWAWARLGGHQGTVCSWCKVARDAPLHIQHWWALQQERAKRKQCTTIRSLPPASLLCPLQALCSPL